MKSVKLIIFLAFFFNVFSKFKFEKCPKQFEAPEKCFDISELLDYTKIAAELENFYEKYLDLLAESDLIVDEREVCNQILNIQLNFNKNSSSLALIYSTVNN